MDYHNKDTKIKVYKKESNEENTKTAYLESLVCELSN
jgi:hypothetical protein